MWDGPRGAGFPRVPLPGTSRPEGRGQDCTAQQSSCGARRGHEGKQRSRPLTSKEDLVRMRIDQRAKAEKTGEEPHELAPKLIGEQTEVAGQRGNVHQARATACDSNRSLFAHLLKERHVRRELVSSGERPAVYKRRPTSTGLVDALVATVTDIPPYPTSNRIDAIAHATLGPYRSCTNRQSLGRGIVPLFAGTAVAGTVWCT